MNSREFNKLSVVRSILGSGTAETLQDKYYRALVELLGCVHYPLERSRTFGHRRLGAAVLWGGEFY